MKRWLTRLLPGRLVVQLLAQSLRDGRDEQRARLISSLREELTRNQLRELVTALYESERHRRILVDILVHEIKASAPPVDQMPFDLPPQGELGFEDLMGLFSSTNLDELIITMNVRQSAYLFGLIRRMPALKVIEIGRHWGGSTLLIAAAMRGQGQFWSIGDPAMLEYDIRERGREMARPVEDQVVKLCQRLGLRAELLVGNSREIEVETGKVDLVFIDGYHSYDAVRSDFERFGTRLRIGGALLFDDAVYDEFHEPGHTGDVKRVVAEISARSDFKMVRSVKRLAHFERVS